MTNSRNAVPPRLLLIGLLLVAGCSMASAHEPRMHGPNGDGGSCQDAAAPAAAATPAKAVAATASSHADKIKPVITVRGGGDDGVSHTPRWHSFLPGMFR